MSLQEVFATMQEKNIVVSELDGELVIRAPQGAMNQALMARLKVHKQDLLAALRNGVVMEGHTAILLKITPDMLPLVSLTQDEIDLIVDSVAEGAAGIQDIYPLAPLQEGILFHHLLETHGDPYITRSIIVFDNRTRLDAFLGALQTVINRHDILRSSVRWDGLSQPVQVVHRHALLPVEELASVEKDLIQQCLLERTDPRQLRMNLQYAPLLAGYAVQDSQSDECWFAMLNHHMVDDNYTLQLILSEIRLLLSGLDEQLPPIQPYRNFIAQMRADSPADHESYFRRQLGDIDESTAPFGLLNVQGSGGQVFEAVLSLESDLAQRIRNSARQHSATPASLFHLAWALVVGQCSGRVDVVFGTVLSGRLQGGGAGADKAVGLFINTLPIRISLNRTVRELVGITHLNLNELLMHEQASLALAQRCSAVPASVPLFTALLNYRHSNMIVASDQSALLEWEGMRVISSEERTNYPLTLSVDDLGQGFGLTVQSIGGINPTRIAVYLRTAIEGLVTALEQKPQQSVDSIGILSEIERKQVLFDFNDTAVDYPVEKSLHALFEVQVEKTPDADAVAFAGQSLSYGELNAKANQLAHYLRGKGVGSEVLVGLCVRRSMEMTVGILGIMKAGGAYVPIDPNYPEQRIAYMLDDARITVLLTQQTLAETLPHSAKHTICLDSDWADVAEYSADNPVLSNHPLDPAYIIYTSGSTGQPKGVTVSHGNAVHSTIARFVAYREPVRAYLLLSSFAFDSSVAGLFWTLGQGGCLYLPSDEAAKDPAVLTDIIANQQVSHLLALPSFYASLLKQPASKLLTLKTAIVAGEACPAEVVKQHYAALPNVPLYNEYGPTEASVWSSVYQTGSDDTDRPIAIGRPIANALLYILDRSGNPAPIGVQGELYIGGAGVARGYWQRPALTAEKFIPDPFQANGGRLYKTGDLARYRPDGNIEFLGRIDQQVKIRGFRIELGEIEAKLIGHPSVAEIVVLAREDQPGNKRLVAYVIARDNAALTEDVLRDAIKQSVPDYMQPSAYVFLDEFPLTANGKVNRKALLPPDSYVAAIDGRPVDKPADPIEQALAAIWMELLGIMAVGVNQNFFDLGGHSLLAIQVVSRIQEHFGIELAMEDIFQNTTIKELAGLVMQAQLGQLADEDMSALLEEMERLSDEEADMMLKG
ncbi:amino acid adenylation domain-containing protein [Methylobacter sp. S3L5C]|uniref:non-ribosomal peptide synthetase n=1 Tax=Methylobacter sp. S3L5C TaxID=2839024 RepID=UPI001FAC0908|nr:amino acid adenylation domain-containing protein [Methylobacter sp. S3L5C]UOA09648.1 amino acid adenylation domain-containing protein [Methylobacter sp. S3L5C]